MKTQEKSRQRVVQTRHLRPAMLAVALFASLAPAAQEAPQRTEAQDNTAQPRQEKPRDAIGTNSSSTPGPTPASPQQRPRTLAAAREHKNRLARKVDPGSIDAYDTAFVYAVRQRWQDLLDGTRALLHPGKVVLEFNLNQDGSITDMKILDCDMGPLLSALCQAAVLDPAPYSAWSPEMRWRIGADRYRVTITFCGSEGDCARPPSDVRRQLSDLVCELRYQPRPPPRRGAPESDVIIPWNTAGPWSTGWLWGYGWPWGYDAGYFPCSKQQEHKDWGKGWEKDCRHQGDFVFRPPACPVVK